MTLARPIAPMSERDGPMFDDGHTIDIWSRVAHGYIELLTPLVWTEDTEPGPRAFLQTVKRSPVEADNLIRGRDDLFAQLTTPTPAARAAGAARTPRASPAPGLPGTSREPASCWCGLRKVGR